MDLGKVIQKQRKKMNYSQEELANILYVSRSTISNWETGRYYPDIRTVVLISEKLNISLDELLKGDPKMINNLQKNTTINLKNKKILLSIVIILLMIIIFLTYSLNKDANISNIQQVKAVEIVDGKMNIDTKLPFYRSLDGYFANYNKQDSSSIDIILNNKIDWSFKNTKSVDIDINDEFWKQRKKINIVDTDINVIYSFQYQ